MEFENYTFEEFEQNLDDGYQIFCTYVRNRYLIFKTSENCYTQKLLSIDEKNPQPRQSIITHKRLKEMFPFMEEIEYKVRCLIIKHAISRKRRNYRGVFNGQYRYYKSKL